MKLNEIATTKDIEALITTIEGYRKAVDELLAAYSTKMVRKYVTASEARKYLGFGRTVLDELVAQGKIKAYRINDKPTSTRYFLWEDILQLEKQMFT